MDSPVPAVSCWDQHSFAIACGGVSPGCTAWRDAFTSPGVLIAAPLGAYIQYFDERPGSTRSLTLATAVLAFLWMTTTSIAFAFILKGKVQQHRQWMTRSYAVAAVFLENRVKFRNSII